ncbi:PQQ-dependent sugar dehydrogenase [Dactylosporangium fulvum]|uniref:PQQ-dependent sugar dehydrogenase n=1 Tax=Dactylosporangium fulvum TaxID=53359 RepID=A0ABY5W4U5_9ACTN|nr:PQQ-dependent sugar dehydrogenase [Dactylosporangium fulvum]UWP85088.1 PQQ-dependent sugar dehydrogenase [Dactylosporangium fulvum]
MAVGAAAVRGWVGGALSAVLALSPVAGCAPGPAAGPGPARSPPSSAPGPDPTDLSPGPDDPSTRGDALVSVTTQARHLDIPWGVTFLPDGGALVTERRTARILKVGPGRQRDGELTVSVVATVTEANADTEGGLLGIAASPSYADDRTVFVYYSTTTDNRIAKLRLSGGPRPIVTGIPSGGVHNGGRLAFGPDGYLYASTGDASRNENAQHLDSLGGKILRMTPDGRPAPGNPFPGSLVWSYGHRNPEGMAWDSRGTMFVAEIGEAVWDELNVVRPGRNYGWPAVEGIGGDPRYTDPVVAWHPEVGVSAGVAIAGRTAVVTCLRGQRVYLVPLGGGTASGAGGRRVEGDASGVRWRTGAGVAGHPVEALDARYGRLRTAIRAPDGSIWLSTSNRDGRNDRGPALDDDRILRLRLRGPAG